MHPGHRSTREIDPRPAPNPGSQPRPLCAVALAMLCAGLLAILCAGLPTTPCAALAGGLLPRTARAQTPATLAISAQGSSDLLIVLDASGSMWGQIQGENKIVIARRVLAGLVDEIEEGRNVGLIAYGHRSEGDCTDIETVSPLAPLNRAELKKTIDALNPKGKTPITDSLRQAVDIVRGTGNRSTVILVSDGLETCGGDPCALVAEARGAGVDFILHVVGFDVAKEDVSSLECAAQAGGGLFLTAENASELSGAMEAAVALPAEAPVGRLVVKAEANGKLHDVAIQVVERGSRAPAGGGRTYTSPKTNPREIPLADGRYDVTILAMGLEGNIRRQFPLEIENGSTVEKEFDFTSGEISIGATRNGAPSDARFTVYSRGTKDVAATGRTYTAMEDNPKVVAITPGEYDIELDALEIGGTPTHRFRPITVEPGKRVEVTHDFTSGEVQVGVKRGAELVDATVNIKGFDGTEVGAGRTYVSESSNPKNFTVPPGTYLLKVGVLRGERYEREITVKAGETVTETFEVP